LLFGQNFSVKNSPPNYQTKRLTCRAFYYIIYICKNMLGSFRVSDNMYTLDFLGTTQIYLQSESELIYKSVQEKPIERCISDLHLFYRNGEKEVKKLDFDFSCFITFSKDSKYLFVASGDERNIICYQLSDMSVVWKIKIKKDIGTIYFCNDKLYCECHDGIQAFNAKNGELLEKLRATSCDDVFPLGSRYLCMLFRGYLRIYDMKDGKYVYKQQYFRKEDDYSLVWALEQTEDSTTVKLAYGKSLVPGGEQPDRIIVFKISDFCLN